MFLSNCNGDIILKVSFFLLVCVGIEKNQNKIQHEKNINPFANRNCWYC